MTASDATDWSHLQRYRLDERPLLWTEDFGRTGAFAIPLEGQLWNVLCSDSGGWLHVSVTNRQRKQLPPWPVMCRIKEMFFTRDEWAVQYHPAKGDYVNDHPFVLHLWSPLDEPLPRPPLVFV